MTSNLVNLNKARKAKARAEKEQRAAENRIQFGRTKAEREAERLKRGLAETRLEEHRRADAAEDGGSDDESEP